MIIGNLELVHVIAPSVFSIQWILGKNSSSCVSCFLVIVLVSWGSYDKYHRLGGLNNKHLFLTVVEAEKLKIKVPTNLVSCDSPRPNL